MPRDTNLLPGTRRPYFLSSSRKGRHSGSRGEGKQAVLTEYAILKRKGLPSEKGQKAGVAYCPERYVSLAGNDR